jgi:hypothetical protein
MKYTGRCADNFNVCGEPTCCRSVCSASARFSAACVSHGRHSHCTTPCLFCVGNHDLNIQVEGGGGGHENGCARRPWLACGN